MVNYLIPESIALLYDVYKVSILFEQMILYLIFISHYISHNVKWMSELSDQSTGLMKDYWVRNIYKEKSQLNDAMNLTEHILQNKMTNQ